MTADTITRTQDEIVARIREVEASRRDWMGVQTSDLVGALDYAHAQPFLREGTTELQWRGACETEPSVLVQAETYMKFAMEKASGHRGLSAGRSIDHYRAWLWLLGVDDQIDWDAFPQYGAPILQQICEVMGWQAIWVANTSTALDRMARGLQCREDDDPWAPCEDGCGR